jgi:hypothetical protein
MSATIPCLACEEKEEDDMIRHCIDSLLGTYGSDGLAAVYIDSGYVDVNREGDGSRSQRLYGVTICVTA